MLDPTRVEITKLARGHARHWLNDLRVGTTNINMNINYNNVSTTQQHLWCYHRSSLSLANVITEKTAGDLSWPEMTLATWRRVTARNVPTQCVKCTYSPMLESVSNGFRTKQAPPIFLPLTYNGEVTKLTWPWVTAISKFRDTHFVDSNRS